MIDSVEIDGMVIWRVSVWGGFGWNYYLGYLSNDYLLKFGYLWSFYVYGLLDIKV